MSRHVIILGAGASRSAGGPLMSDFLDRAEAFRGRGGRIDNRTFDLVFHALAELRIAHSKAELDIDNVESVLAAFEMARIFGSLGRVEPADVERLPQAMGHVIARTIEHSIRYRVESRRFCAPSSYRQLSAILQRLTRARQTAAVLTFNYDLASDLAVHDAQLQPRYSLPQETTGNFDLLKLHGSLAWTTRADTQAVVAVPLARYRDFSETGFAPPDDDCLFISDYLQSFDFQTTAEPVIVPPVWSKTRYYEALASVWRKAAHCLADAENIYVLGYSLPDTDQFFRLLYALGTVGETRLKRFWVYDPDSRVEDRFRALLGQAARRRFLFYNAIYDNGLAMLEAALEDQHVFDGAG